MISDHDDVHASVDRAEGSVAEWAASGGAAAGDRLVTNLAELGRLLTPHLDREEETVVPLCAEHLTVEEWGEMPGHALGSYDGDKVWLILGLIRRHMTETQRAAMLEHMPPPARDMWVNAGEANFEKFMSALGGPAED